MAWREDSKGKFFAKYPYRIEHYSVKYKLYKYVKLPGDHWTMELIGKYDRLEDAKEAAEEDERQKSLWGR